MGYGIPERRHLFASQLESLMAEEQRPLEIINLGVSGYQTMQEVATLSDKGLAYRPDLVILQSCLNDFSDPWPAARYFTERLLEQERKSGASAASRLGVFALHSALWRLLRYAAVPQQLGSEKDPSTDAASAASLQGDTVDDALKWLGELRDARGFRVLVVLFPSADLGAGDEAVLHQRLQSASTKYDFAFLDLTDDMRQCGDVKGLYLDHWHPSEMGHRCAARAMAREIRPLLFSSSNP